MSLFQQDYYILRTLQYTTITNSAWGARENTVTYFLVGENQFPFIFSVTKYFG
jgi:hypothetical protein